MATAPKAPLSTVPWSPDLGWKKGMNEKKTEELLALLDALFVNFSWCIWHEGERSYDEGQRDQFRQDLSRRDFNAIRALYNGRQAHNPNARNLLAAVTNADIEVI